VREPSCATRLTIVALESHRAQAVIVSEALGTREPRVCRGIFSCRLVWFEAELWPSVRAARWRQ